MLSSKYKEFNKWVYEYYFVHALGSYSNVASIFENIFEIKNHEYFFDVCTFLNATTWSDICYRQANGIPLYLGLIAVQLLAAASRQKDNLCTPNAYNPRLQEILFISPNELQQKYRDAQENIYNDFEQWCKKNEFAIYLSKDSSSHRYVQYPLSLSLLNKNDLFCLANFFNKCGLQAKDEIDYYWFKEIVCGHISCLSSTTPSVYRKWNKISDNELRNAILKQIYSAFLNWDGSYIERGNRYNSSNICRAKDYTMYWIGTPENEPEFYCNNELMSNLPSLIKNGCFFMQDPAYHNEWSKISDHNLRTNSQSKYVFVYNQPTEFIEDIKKVFEISLYEYETIKILYFEPHMIKMILERFPEHFKAEPSLRLIGGLKIGHRKWLHNAGPVIDTENYSGTTARLINYKTNEKTVINIADQPLINLPDGRYLLQYSPEAPAISFSISSECHKPFHHVNGWNVDKNGINPSASPPFHIQGLDFSLYPLDAFPESTEQDGNCLRQWIDLASGKNKSVIKNENIIHKALRRNLNGIRNR